MSVPKTIHWGILATGEIATTFTKDLLASPTTRDVTAITHTVVAAASSSSKSRAEYFLRQCNCPSTANAYGSYEELVHDPDVDIVYIATPHSHHYQNAMLALEAGKNVLCEKAFTVNAAQAKKLVDKAREKNVFLMEAVWTRYFPICVYLRQVIESGTIGPVARVMADLSVALSPEKSFADGKHRMVNPNLAGGALLDLGVYSLNWIFQTLYYLQPPETRKPQVIGALKMYDATGSADETASIVLTFPRPQSAGGDAHAIATASMRVATPPGDRENIPCVRIQGLKGEIQIFNAVRPTRFRLVLVDGTVEDQAWPQPGPGEGSGWYNGFNGKKHAEGEGQGMFWEADEAAFALVEGRKEGRYLGLEESIRIMEVMDEIRRQAGLRYPDKIETTDFPVNL
ncbi:hypothetical protein V1520DRAFT_376281 [Lipomyces starkeyi]|uniref:D-xylose 1-dehydrogenase (NADP(+), D-xylono-1,5-lactone-forming) n=1 Tax=Lipomyces starkeyi NRRL Y-11557 TaxID=675824 RepID=A0A1E3QCD3_LIPST|nr:hypothetical protein LIPSTDRAFT_335868 [Lipomyces starkeyi NRRL Y-11557]